MININKKYMTTTAIGIIILSSFLFFTQNVEQIKHEDKKIIQEEVPEVKIETKTEIKTKNPIIVEKPVIKQEEIKIPEKKVYKPEYPDFEVFEQSETPKEERYTKNFNRFTQDFHKVKIRSDGTVPITNEQFSLDNPQNFSAMNGYIPGIFSLDFLQKDITEIEVISTLESISGVEVVEAIKDTYGFTVTFNISKLTQGEIYELEKNIKANRYIDFIEKRIITLPEYNTREYKKAREKYESDMDEI